MTLSGLVAEAGTTPYGVLVAACLAFLAACSGDSWAPPPAPAPTSVATVNPNTPPVISTPWAAVGPAPPAIEAPIAAHAPSGTIYMASLGGGVLKSTDRGGTFRAVNTGLGSRLVAAMVMAADDPNTVYLGTFGGGIFKTTDGGANWAITGELAGLTLFLAIDPTNANIVFAGYNGAVPFRRSTDGGATWINGTGIPANTPLFALAVDPRDQRVLYAGGPGNGAFKSTDRGATWTALTIDSTVWTLLVDPDDSRTIYAGGNGSGVFRSRDAGASFARIGTPGDGVVLTLAKSGGTLYAGTTSTGVLTSRDDGTTWTASSAPLGLVIALSVDSQGTLYAGTGQGGAVTAPRGTTAWAPLGAEALQTCLCQNVYSAAVDPSNSLHVVLGTNDGGLIETRNGGRSWSDAGAAGFVNRSPRSIVFDPTDPQRVYAGSFTGGGFFRSLDGGRSWQRRQFGPSTLHATNIAVDPSDRSVYLFTLQSGGVWKSTDLGDTFRRIDVAVAGGPFLNLGGRGIVVDPNQPATVYTAGAAGTWRSLDRGATWTRVSTVAALTVNVDPTSSRVVYVGTNTSGVLKSIDGGATFAASNVGLTDLRTGRTGGVLLHRSNPQTLYVNTEGGGMFKSTDAGGSWSAINGSLTELTVFGLALDPNNPNTLYAATPQSVFKTVTGGQ